MLNLRVSVVACRRTSIGPCSYSVHPVECDPEAGLLCPSTKAAKEVASVWMKSIEKLQTRELSGVARTNKAIQTQAEKAAEREKVRIEKVNRLNAQIEAGAFSLVG